MQRPLRYPSVEASDLAVRLYRFESGRVAGPGSSSRDINDVLWTKQEARDALGVDEGGSELLDELLESLLEQNHLMVVPDWKDGEEGLVTRAAETLRMIGHTYEYWPRGRPGIDAIRWEVVPKYIPRRFITPEQFTEKLIVELSKSHGSDVGETALGQACREVIEGVSTKLHGKSTLFSQFQFKAALRGLLDALGFGSRGSILVAGVGSGKTLAFMLPPLILARRDIIEGREEYGAHLFLYPRTALTLDQYTKALIPFAVASGIPEGQIHSEMSQNYGGVLRGIRRVHSSAQGPRLVVCSLETLKRRMSHPLIVKRLLRRLQTVTMDEVHLVSGVQGAQIAMLMRRLRKITPSECTWCGASATIAKPEEHLGRLIGEVPDRIRLEMPDYDEMVTDGVVHHSFARPSGLISTAGTLVNATSLLIHSRRDDLSDRPSNRLQRNASPKAIAFADNLELLGRWNTDFRENERTDEFDNGRHGTLRSHPTADNPGEWDELQREIPYAHRFQNPLQRRIASQGGRMADSGERVLLPVLTDDSLDNELVCQRCKSGERFQIDEVDAATMRQIGTLPYRSPHMDDGNFVPFVIDNPIFSQGGVVGTMDMCPFLRAGACTWFSKTPVGSTSRIGNVGGTIRWDFAGRATSRIQSSKSEKNDDAPDLSDAVFDAPYEELHSVRGAIGNDFVNLVMASPTLEVGVDLPNLTEGIMHKAVRNIASYRQKSGRVGRESMSEALNVTLATDSALDLHFYRQPRKLIDRGRLEPVPLKERNEAVAKSTGYLAIWDWVCYHCVIPEDLGYFTDEVAVRSLQEAAMRLSENEAGIRRHVSDVLDDDRYNQNSEWIGDALEQVKAEISLLLRPISGYSFEPALDNGSGNCVLGMKALLRGARAIPTGQTVHDIREMDESIERAKLRRRDCGFIGEYDEDLMDMVDRILGTKSPMEDDLEDAVDRLRGLERSDKLEPDEKRGAKRLRKALDDVLDPVSKMASDGIQTDVFRVIEQYQSLGKGEEGWRRYFLSDTVRALDAFKDLRKHEWFVSPDALFIHPHSENVILRCFPEGSIRDDQAVIPVNEALHSFLPGMWTMRLPQAVFKVAARETEPTGFGGVLRADLDRMEQQGMRTRTIERSLPAPPGRPLDRTIRIVTPLEITLLRRGNSRYVNVDEGGPRVFDGDEGPRRGHRNRPVRIPRSFMSRWLHVRLDDGEPVGPYLELGEGENLIVTDRGGRNEEEIGPDEILHPFQNTAFESVEWHEDATVIEYVYGLSRTISSDQGYGSELIYTDRYGGEVAFGSKIRTEGVALSLHRDMVNKTTEGAFEEIIRGNTKWFPSVVRALRSHLVMEAMSTGGALSGFDVEDVVSIIVVHLLEHNRPLDPESITASCRELLEDEGLLIRYITERVDAKMGTPDEEGFRHPDDEERRGRRIENMQGVFTRSVEGLSESSESFAEFLPLWLHRAILMSFGVTAVTALQRLSGGDNGEVGYGLTDESWAGEDAKVVIYDRAERGNGNSAVARTFMHIPNIIRSAKGERGALLPSVDYMSILEEALLPCPQHQSDLLGMEYIGTSGEDSVIHNALSDVKDLAREVYRVSGETWRRLGIAGAEDGWKLPLMHMARREVAISEGLERDDVTRATKICWNGCPECVDRIDVAQGGHAGMDYLDRTLLDSWFRYSRGATEDYHHISPSDLAGGNNPLSLGALHSLALRTPNQRLRSSLLPWTIGVDMPRDSIQDGLTILIRQSDLVGLKIGRGGAAIPATGVKRLLWFDLMMTAYLDICGMIPDERKELSLVFYDARDVSFDDVGIAPRMLDGLREVAVADGVAGMERLSDILIWLAKRGFKVRLCIDAGVRANVANQPVRNLLRVLASARTDGNMELYEREVRDPEQRRRNMHKKILVTPIYALIGSSNLTESGTRANEEIGNHVMFGDPDYDGVRTSCEDTFAMARPI